MVNPIQPIFTSKFYDWIFFFAFYVLKDDDRMNRKWVFRLKVNDLNVICILLMQRQSITHEKYFLFIFYVCAYLSTEVKPIYHFINLTLNSPTPPGVLSQKKHKLFFHTRWHNKIMFSYDVFDSLNSIFLAWLS